jgi:hypothetical protein
LFSFECFFSLIDFLIGKLEFLFFFVNDANAFPDFLCPFVDRAVSLFKFLNEFIFAKYRLGNFFFLFLFIFEVCLR